MSVLRNVNTTSFISTQVARFFSEVFRELVPDGKGQLTLKKVDDPVSASFIL